MENKESNKEPNKEFNKESNKEPNKRTQILEEISRKNDIRTFRPEYRIILDTLQISSPMTIKSLQEEINEIYGCEMFTYKQLYDITESLLKKDAVKINHENKEISINPEYVILPQLLPVSSYSIYLLAITIIIVMVSLVRHMAMEISIVMLITGIFYILAQRFGSEFKVDNNKK